MKFRSFVGGATVLALAGVAGAAQLHLELTSDGSSHDPDGTSFGVGSVRGGLFRLTINNVDDLVANQLGGDIVTGNSFLSFCVEVTEFVSPPANYVFNVNTVSISGGASPNNPQPLVAQTAYLYSKFREGTVGSLVTGGFTQSNDNDVNALQDAIWYFQHQLGAADVNDNGSVTLSTKAQDFVDAANDAVLVSGIWSGIGNVRILNLGVNGVNQDQLALVPVPVPLPQGAAMASVGLVLLTSRRRRGL